MRYGRYPVTAIISDPNYIGSASGTLVIGKATPIVTWEAPAAISYGTGLSNAQLDATANVPGIFVYAPNAGSVLAANVHLLNATFTPTDSVNYSTASASATLTVNKATAAVAFNAGTLNQTYTGTTKNVATTTTPTGLTVNVSFTGTPSNAGSYPVTASVSDPNYTGSASATLVIGKATPIVTWAAPTAISYGTALSGAQLDASANVPGVFAYAPALGTVLAVGSQTLTATFTPSDTANYTTAPANVGLTVNKASATVSFNAGTLNQTYNGTQKTVATTTTPPGLTVNVSFTGAPTNAGGYPVTASINDADYTGSASGTLSIGKAVPIVTWATPTAITYGTALSSTQLNASANVPGTFVYSPSVGTVLGAGAQDLSASFTPTDATDYASAPANVSITVNKGAADDHLGASRSHHLRHRTERYPT